VALRGTHEVDARMQLNDQGYVVLRRIDDAPDLEARKIRFAVATFTGLLMLFVFVASLYYEQNAQAGQDIFDKSVSAMTALAGGIIGYMFGARSGGDKPAGQPPANGGDRRVTPTP
jgi:hypothetical protein